MRYVVCYDIADDGRRDDIATLLSGSPLVSREKRLPRPRSHPAGRGGEA